MAQMPDTDGRAGNKDSTPQGQNQGQDFCRDFAQPSQVVQGDAAKLGATEGLPQPGPAKTARPAQQGARIWHNW